MNTSTRNYYQFQFPCHTDSRGDLFPIEFSDDLPFVPKRVYFLKNTPSGITRGAHCHWVEEEIFMCIAGSVIAWIDSDGKGKTKVELNNPQSAIYIGKKVWHEFSDFSEDAVLLALSSVHYMPGEENYEWDYEIFKEIYQK